MPHLRGITVHVTDAQGNDFEEWGIQTLRKDSLASAYIRSTTNMPFMVSVRPSIPFVNAHTLRSGGLSPKHSTNEDKNHSQLQGAFRNSSRHLRSMSEDQMKNEVQQRTLRSSPLRQPPHQETFPPPEFSLLASLYLDGRQKPEKRIIIHLDPADADFLRPDGKVMFRYRWVQAKDGTMKEHAWVFEDRAVENVFSRLVIAGAQGHEAETQDEREDDMINALRSAGLKEETDHIREEQSKVGQIIVQIERVVIGDKRIDSRYRSRHQEGHDEDIDMDGVKPNITHAAGFVPKSTIKSAAMRVIDYWPYKEGEPVFAEFRFFYRSQEQLEKYNFTGFNSTLKPLASNARTLNYRMANLTPLSISNPTPKQKSKRRLETFEDKIKKKLCNPETKAEHNVESDLRDASPSKENTCVKTDEKHPAVALPLFARTTTLGSLKSKGKLPTLATIAELDVATSAAVLLPSAEQQMGSIVEPNTPIRLDKSSSGTPASLNAESSSSPPSITSLTKEKASNLKITDKDSLRLPSHYQSDFEADADDEAENQATSEFDLETQIGDLEEHEYSLNPAENEEAQRVLRSRLAKVNLGKRTRADVEDGNGEEGNDDGVVDEETTLLLVEIEDTHAGKKVRTQESDFTIGSTESTVGPDSTKNLL